MNISTGMSKAIEGIRKIESELALACQQVDSVAKFLDELFSLSTKRLKFFSHTYFCKAAGFGSRNAVREIISKRKIMTLSSYSKIAKTLDLSPPLNRFFSLLVHQEYPELRLVKLNALQTKSALERQRKILQAFEVTKPSSGVSSTLFADRSYMQVYAAISSLEPGTSLGEIVSRTRLKVQAVEKVLGVLERNKLVLPAKGQDRFVTHSSHLFFEHLGGKEYFKSAYEETLTELSKNMNSLYTRKDNLFMQSIFNIDTEQLPALVAALKKTIGSFVDESASEEGDRVAKLAVAFYL